MNIIIVFAKSEDAENFKSILSRGGYDGMVTCTSGAQALSAMEDLGSGVVISGYRLSDMLYSELAVDLPILCLRKQFLGLNELSGNHIARQIAL